MPRRKKRTRKKKQKVGPQTRGPESLDREWSRAGARNIAGVTFQVAVTVRLLVEGLVGRLPIASVTPEGDEDVDCVRLDGSSLLVQVKERQKGEGTLARSSVGQIVGQAFRRSARPCPSEFILVTNAQLGSELPFTGWNRTLAELCSDPQLADLAAAIPELRPEDARLLLERAHCVRLSWAQERDVIGMLAGHFEVPSAVAHLLHALLLKNVSRIASEQRFKSPEEAISIVPSEVEVTAQRLLETVDVNLLEMPIRSGAIDVVDFIETSVLDQPQFFSGVDVEPSHIAAGLDLPRPRELSEIAEALRSDRFVVVVGPSGCGKSALVWRTAYENRGLLRSIRLRRVEEADVMPIVRWVRAQEPTPEVPLLICADDLGRPLTLHWVALASRLLEVPHVFLLGSARHEDFRPELTLARALIVEPRLDHELAIAIHDTLLARGIVPRLVAEEAYPLAGGLLMEYLHLLVEGRRLRDVVGQQADARLAEGRRAEREVLRYVCASHVVGLSLPASSLPGLARAEDVAPDLVRLREEHMVTTDDRERWVGLHELRSRVLHRRLHEYPPPTESETFAQMLPYFEEQERVHCIIRYAEETTAPFDPLAIAVRTLVVDKALSAGAIAALLAAFREAQATRHAVECIETVLEAKHPGDPFHQTTLAYLSRFAGRDFSESFPALASLRRLGEQFPERPPSVLPTIAAGLTTSRVVALAENASAEVAQRLLEALEGALKLDLAEAHSIWLAHSSAPMQSRAGLAPALLALLPEGEDFNAALDNVECRLEQFVKDHPSGLSYEWKVSEPEACAIVHLLHPGAEGDPHTQAVEAANVLLQVCPEANFAEIVTFWGDGERFIVDGHEPAYKRIPRENMPRETAVRANATFLDAARRAIAARSWTQRMRLQAVLAQRVEDLVRATYDRLLHDRDNAGRRQRWLEESSLLAKETQELPPPPAEGLNRNTPDPAKKALTEAATSLQRLGREIESPLSNTLLQVGNCLRTAAVDAEQARRSGMLTMAGLRDPIQGDLPERLWSLADLLLVLADGPEYIGAGRGNCDSTTEYGELLVKEACAASAVEEERRIREHFGSADLYRLPGDKKDGAQLFFDRWLVVNPVEASLNLENWATLATDLERLAFRVYIVMANTEGVVLPALGFQLGATKAWPLEISQIHDLCGEANLESLKNADLDAFRAFVGRLKRASRSVVLGRLRTVDLGRLTPEADGREALRAARDIAEGFNDSALRDGAKRLLVRVEAEHRKGDSDLLVQLARSETGVSTEILDILNQLLFALVLKNALS